MRSSIRHILSFASAAVVVTTLCACVLGMFSVKASRLTVVGRSDTLRGDEPYLGMIRFRSQFGTPGSTDILVLDELRTLGDQVRPGSSVAIPDDVGDVEVGPASPVSREDADKGIQPGLGGVIYIAMEEDHGGKDAVRNTLRDTAERLRKVLEKHVEQATWSDLALPLALAKADAELASGTGDGRCGLLDTRLCKFFKSRLGDDFIGRAVAIYVDIEDAYFQELLPIWQNVAASVQQQWPGCDDISKPICPIGTRSQVLSLDDPGDGSYRLSLEATFDTGSGH